MLETWNVRKVREDTALYYNPSHSSFQPLSLLILAPPPVIPIPPIAHSSTSHSSLHPSHFSFQLLLLFIPTPPTPHSSPSHNTTVATLDDTEHRPPETYTGPSQKKGHIRRLLHMVSTSCTLLLQCKGYMYISITYTYH